MKTLTESIADFVIDLFDQYGSGSSPRPSGGVIAFTVVHKNATYAKAKADIDALLAVHGLRAQSLTITPGPEEKSFINRAVSFTVAKSALV